MVILHILTWAVGGVFIVSGVTNVVIHQNERRYSLGAALALVGLALIAATVITP